MKNPKVSVIMPAYNAAALIAKSIDSVLKQTFSDLELVVADDGSTDNTSEVVKAIKDPRVKYVKKENGGAASARNFGIKNSSGQYIAYCDSDDLFSANHVKLLADYLDGHETKPVGCDKILSLVVGDIHHGFRLRIENLHQFFKADW